MRRRTPVSLLVLCLLTCFPANASADPRSDSSFRGGLVEVGASRTKPTHAAKGSSTPRKPSQGLPVEVVKTPACGRNGPEGSFGDDFCGASNRLCPPGQTFATTWTRTGDAPWVNGGSRCTAAAADAGPVVLPVVTEADLRRLPLPAGVVELQPRTGRALLHVPLVLRTGADVVVRDTTVLGYPVTVRATPTTWTWDLGDGTTLGPTADPGNPYPRATLTHAYGTPGEHAITLTTTYTGEYSIAGLPYRPVAGTATVVSAPTAVHVREGSGVLTR
jgi:PKD domain